jgi:hypothetical protein
MLAIDVTGTRLFYPLHIRRQPFSFKNHNPLIYLPHYRSALSGRLRELLPTQIFLG